MKIIKSYLLYNVVISSLVVAIGLVSYFYYSQYSSLQKTNNLINIEKASLLAELNSYKADLEKVSAENINLLEDLNNEKLKVNSLLNEISQIKLNLVLIIKYKAEIKRLGAVVLSLTKEKFVLKNNIKILQSQRDSTTTALFFSKNRNDTLVDLNQNLSNLVHKASRVSLINLKAVTHKKSNSGVLKKTEKARKANLVQISYTAVGSKISKPCQKEYFVQIIDSKNNMLGHKQTKKFGKMILDYSYVSSVDFKNESVNIVKDFEIENAEKGTYFVNIFDKSDLVIETVFVLN